MIWETADEVRAALREHGATFQATLRDGHARFHLYQLRTADAPLVVAEYGVGSFEVLVSAESDEAVLALLQEQ